MLTLRTFLQTVYGLSFPVMLVKVVRSMMVTSVFGRSVSLADPSAELKFLRAKKAKEEWKLAEKLCTSFPRYPLPIWRPAWGLSSIVFSLSYSEITWLQDDWTI